MFKSLSRRLSWRLSLRRLPSLDECLHQHQTSIIAYLTEWQQDLNAHLNTHLNWGVQSRYAFKVEFKCPNHNLNADLNSQLKHNFESPIVASNSKDLDSHLIFSWNNLTSNPSITAMKNLTYADIENLEQHHIQGRPQYLNILDLDAWCYNSCCCRRCWCCVVLGIATILSQHVDILIVNLMVVFVIVFAFVSIL